MPSAASSRFAVSVQSAAAVSGWGSEEGRRAWLGMLSCTGLFPLVLCPGQGFSKVRPLIVVCLDSRLTRRVRGAETYRVCLGTRAVCSGV